VRGVLGKGVFSTVLKCIDLRSPASSSTTATTTTTTNNNNNNNNIVAVKMIRNNEIMKKTAEKEKKILLLIREFDLKNQQKYQQRNNNNSSNNNSLSYRSFLIHLQSVFEYRQHVCFVFESLAMNLRDTLKHYGKHVGITLQAISIYGKQLYIALHHLYSLGIVHADIKLDNVLITSDLKSIKLCDFGSAFFTRDSHENVPTPYLVSRFYRAPEIMLGLEYDYSIDIWSVAVSLYELFTGHVMFPGRSNNEMLKLIMEIKGKVPNKMIKQHLRSFDILNLDPHFIDNNPANNSGLSGVGGGGPEQFKFRCYEEDVITHKPILKIIDLNSFSSQRNIAQLLYSSKAQSDDWKAVSYFAELLENCLHIDPMKRYKPLDALKHPFFNPNHSQVNNHNNNHQKK
jgi:serine/threonine-protein kinase PRP4